MARWFGKSAVVAVAGAWKCQGARCSQAPVIGAVAVISIFLTWKFSRGGGECADDEERTADDNLNVDDSDEAVLEDMHPEVLEQRLHLRSTIEDIPFRPVQSDHHLQEIDSASESPEYHSPSTLHDDDRMKNRFSIQNSDFEDKIENIPGNGDARDNWRGRRSVDTYIMSSTRTQRVGDSRLHFTSRNDEDNVSKSSRHQVQAGDSERPRMDDAGELSRSSQIPREVELVTVVRDAHGKEEIGFVTHVHRAADEKRDDFRSTFPVSSEAESPVQQTRCDVAFDRSGLGDWTMRGTMPTSYLIGRRKGEDPAHSSTSKVGCDECELTQTTNWRSSFLSDPGHKLSIDSQLFTTKMASNERLGEPSSEASNQMTSRYNSDVTAEELSNAISGTFPSIEFEQTRHLYFDTNHYVHTNEECFGSTPTTGAPSLEPEKSTSCSSSALSERQRSYDEYLADPELSPTMRSQVLRAKSSLAKYFEDTDGE